MAQVLYSLLHLPVTAGAAGDNTLIPAFSGAAIRVHRWFLWIPTATTLIFKDGSTALTGAMAFPDGTGTVLDPSSNQFPWFTTTQGNAFVMNNSTGAAIAGWIDFDYGT